MSCEIVSIFFTGPCLTSKIVASIQSTISAESQSAVSNKRSREESSSPSCILRTERVVLNKFKDVPEEVAIAEGEGDRSLEDWRKIHSDIYSPMLRDWGVDDINDATVITEFFHIVFRSDHTLSAQGPRVTARRALSAELHQLKALQKLSVTRKTFHQDDPAR